MLDSSYYVGYFQSAPYRPFCQLTKTWPNSSGIAHSPDTNSLLKTLRESCEGFSGAAHVYSSPLKWLTVECLPIYYLFMTGINTQALDRELKRGTAELLILSLLDARPRHGYELSKLIQTRSGGEIQLHIDSLYPLLYRLEERGWIKGTWVEKPNERRRRFYKVTPNGRRVLAKQRETWAAFVAAVQRVIGDEHA